MEKSLAARLQAGVEAWTGALLGKTTELDLSMDTYSPAEPTHKPGGEPQVRRHCYFYYYFFKMFKNNQE